MKKLVFLAILVFAGTAHAALPPQPILGYWVFDGIVETFFPSSVTLTTGQHEDVDPIGER